MTSYLSVRISGEDTLSLHLPPIVCAKWGGYQKMADFCRFFSEKLYIIHIMRSLVRFLFYINDLVDYLCLFSSVTADYLTGTAQCFGPVSVGGDR